MTTHKTHLCSKCQQPGHNRRTCKVADANPPLDNALENLKRLVEESRAKREMEAFLATVPALYSHPSEETEECLAETRMMMLGLS